MYDNISRVIEVDINEILPNRFQPRIQFDEEEILELSDSIKEHGVIQPLVVRTIGDKYEIIAGERRYKASVLAGKETVPVIVKNLNDKDSAEVALIENIQRRNLTPIEEALSYKKILDMGYLTQENLASKLGKSQSAVANKIRLLNLSDEVQEALLENKISERHARSLLKLSAYKDQNMMLNRIISERMPVRRADEEIEKLKNNQLDESNYDTQNIIEKGEIEMNNNMFGMPNIPQNPQIPTPNFDMFGTGNQTPVEQSVQPQTTITPSFDIFGGSNSVPEPLQTVPINTSTPVMPEVPSVQPVPEIPAIQPIINEAPVQQPEIPSMEGTQFNINQNEVPNVPSIPEVPSFQSVPEIPAIQPIINEAPVQQPEIPSMEGTQFNINQNEVPSAPVMPEVPNTQLIQEPIVPQTAPIMESPVQMTQQSENLFSFGDMSNNQNTVEESIPTSQPEIQPVPEFKMPEPIIVTDYSKQYDPIMPETQSQISPTVDFKEVINAIRECSNKIEQYGFKIDVEEYDLANLYQVIFKIEK